MNPKIEKGREKALEIRGTVALQRNSAMCMSMEDLYSFFQIGPRGGTQLARQITEYLREQGVVCFPDPLPSQRTGAAVIMLKNARFARHFKPNQPQ
jgi:hypothetical protein